MRHLCCASLAIWLAVMGRAATAPEILNAIRNNDTSALRAMGHRDLVEARDRAGWSALHFAALYGTVDSVRVVLGAGGDPNAQNLAGVTPVMLAAYSLEKTRLLVEKGGDVNLQAHDGSTPLWVALGCPGNEAAVRYLIERGANVKYIMPSGADYLMRAAGSMDADVVKLLLAKGLDPGRTRKNGDTALKDSYRTRDREVTSVLIAAGGDVNAANTDGGRVKNGPIDSFGVTPLMIGVWLDGADGISALLRAGAKPNALDHRHMTALMMAVASDQANPEVIRRLIEGGAEINVADRYGETALDWARKYRDPAVISVLEKAGATEKGLGAAPRKDPSYKPDAGEALRRASALLAKSAESFFPAGGGCVGCHHQPFAGRAYGALRAAQLPAEPRLRRTLLDGMLGERAGEIDRLQVLNPGAGAFDGSLYSLAGLAAMNEPGNDFTDAMVHMVAESQHTSGSWGLTGARPPLQQSEITRTMLAICALKNYGWPARQGEFNERIAKARRWLETAQSWTTVDEADRILGLSLAGETPEELQALGHRVIAEQRGDGGWGQTRYLDSDAFGTSSVLDSLRRAGVLQATDAVYQRGTRYLLSTQFPDGSWYVRSRAVKLQPYFQSGFPYDHDQWISFSATAYAVMALAPAAGKAGAARK